MYTLNKVSTLLPLVLITSYYVGTSTCLWPVKKKKLRRFLTPLCNLQTRAAPFTSEE
jgi:hypothetical protein